MKNFYTKILLFKTILYRIISMLIFGFIFGFKFALYVGILAFIIYYSYDYLFSKIFHIRAENKGFVLWFTGLPCSGKTTLANIVNDYLKNRGFKTERLDGDIVRKELSSDLGFSKKDRCQNIKRVRYLSKILSRNGIVVTASFVSPYRRIRQKFRENINNFVLVYVKCSVDECMKRDTKGMWAKAKSGEIKGFTGYDDPYEIPLNPDIVIDTEKCSLSDNVHKILNTLKKRTLI